MPSATGPLPSNPEALRALVVSLQEVLVTTERELAARDAELHAKTLHIEKLRATYGWEVRDAPEWAPHGHPLGVTQRAPKRARAQVRRRTKR